MCGRRHSPVDLSILYSVLSEALPKLILRRHRRYSEELLKEITYIGIHLGLALEAQLYCLSCVTRT